MTTKENYTAQHIRASEAARKSDEACKAVLKSKWILASILKGVVPEYRDCTLKEIAEKYIEPDQIHSYTPVSSQDISESIEGMDKEQGAFSEATVFFDVKFKALLPDRTKTEIYLLLDVEAQNTYRESRLKYPLEKRAVYYMSRLITSQLKTISKDTNYNSLQKVCSIWICMGTKDIPLRERQSITRYSIQKEDVYKEIEVPRENYDLMTAIFIRLGEEETAEPVIGLLQTLFTDNRGVEERLKKLKEDYGIPISTEFNEEVARMCTYSQAMLEKGEAIGEARGEARGEAIGIRKIALEMLRDGEPLEKIMKYTGYTFEELDALKREI